MNSILIHPTYFPGIVQMTAVVQAKNVVFEVCDNYQKQTYRNRTYIAHSNGKLLLNVPIKHSKNGDRQKTNEVVPEDSFPWQEQHWKSLQSAYRTSPFFEFYEDELEPLFTKKVFNLMQHNLEIFKVLCDLIGIETKISKTSEYKKAPEIKDLRCLVEAKKQKKKFKLQPYTQVLQEEGEFLNDLSVLDLLFNEGPNTLQYLERQQLNF